MTRARDLADSADLAFDGDTLKVDSANNRVGIGTASPSKELHVKGDIDVEADTGGSAVLRFKAEEIHGTVEGINIGNNFGGLAFKTNGNGTTAERMRIDSSGNVGIGTASPAGTLQVRASSPNVYVTSDDTGQSNIYLGGSTDSDAGALRYSDNDDSMRFLTDNGERMRITSGGNVLVGKTADDNGTAGIRLVSDGLASFSRSGASTAIFNRKSSDGVVTTFRKNDGDFGHIRVMNSNNLGIGSSASNHSGLQFGTAVITPLKEGAENDGDVDLGFSNARWKDLYLSGGINLTTTGAASAEITLKQSGTGGRDYRISSTGSGYGSAGNLIVYDATGSSERMRITSGGNVGIGTSSPAYRGHFVDASSATRVQIENTNNAAGGAGIYLTTYSSGNLVSNATLTTDNSGNLKVFTGTTTGTERVRIDSSGRLLVNRTSASNNGLIELDYEPLSARDKGIVLNNSNGTTGGQACNFLFSGTSVGNITTTASSTAYNTSSDYRLKENAVDMTGAITRVKNLQPKRFNFIVDTTDTLVDGFMAHEAQTVVPEAVTGTHNEVQTWTQDEIDAGDAPDNTNAGDNKLDGDGNTIPVYQGIDQAKLVPLLTGALQEAITKIETLETEMTALKARVTTLEGN